MACSILPLPAKQRLCKEYTEFSAEELALLLDGPCGRGCASSDDFSLAGLGCGTQAVSEGCPEQAGYALSRRFERTASQSSEELRRLDDIDAAGHAFEAVSLPDESADPAGGAAARPSAAPLCKEYTEFSARELAELRRDDSCPCRSSDDFCEGALAKGGFFGWYHQQCLQDEPATDDVPANRCGKPVRRVYHNRRKTAWTDYDEELPKEEEKPVIGSSRLVEVLKAAGKGGPTREQVRAAAKAEAQQGGMAAALARTGPCGWTPLLVAAQRRQLPAVEELLALGAEVDCREPTMGWTPLMYAAGGGCPAVVRALLARRAAVNFVAPKHNWSPLCSAIQSGKEEIVQLLLQAGADFQAVKKQHPAIADIYLQEMRQQAAGGR